MIDILWDAFVAKLITADKRITNKFTDTHYLIMTTDDGFECGRTNNKVMYENLHILAEKNKKSLVDVGAIYYFLFGQANGLGWV